MPVERSSGEAAPHRQFLVHDGVVSLCELSIMLVFIRPRFTQFCQDRVQSGPFHHFPANSVIYVRGPWLFINQL